MDESSIRHLRALGPPLAGYLAGYMGPGSRDNAIVARLISQGSASGRWHRVFMVRKESV